MITPRYGELRSDPSHETQPILANETSEEPSLESEETIRQPQVVLHMETTNSPFGPPLGSNDSQSFSFNHEAPAIAHSSKAITPEDSSPSQRTTFSFSDWSWDVFSWAIGTVVFFTLLILLGFFRNRSLSSWHSKVSINAIVSALGQLSQSAFAVSLASCLGQLKWDWVRTKRNIRDIEVFDEASRGPLGSLCLIWKQGIKAQTLHLALLGAFTTVLMVGFTTFIQQGVSIDIRIVSLSTNSTILRTTTYNLDTQPVSAADSPSLIQAVSTGFIKDQIDFPPSLATCPSGNCVWHDYASLGFCSAVNATVEHMNVNCESRGIDASCDFDAPDPSMFTFLSQYGKTDLQVCEAGLLMTSNWTREDKLNLYIFLPSSPGCDLSGSSSSVLSGGGFSVSKGNNDSFVVMQASIQLCVQNHSTTAVSGVFTDSISASIPLLDAPDWQWDQNHTCGRTGNITACFDAVDSQNAQGGYRSYLESNVFAMLSSIGEFDDGSPALTVFRGNSLIGGSLMQDLDPTLARINESFPIDSLKNRLAILTTSLSLGLRNFSGSPEVGAETTSEQYIKVELPWLILPVVLWLFTSAFLLATIIITNVNRVPVWKSSTLILLQCMDICPRLQSAHVLEKQLKQSPELVTLDDSDGWWRLARLSRDPKIQ